MRQYRLPVLRSDRETHPTRDLARAWARASDHVTETEQRLRAVLSLARSLAGAERAIVFDADRIVANVPDPADETARSLFERGRLVLEDELIATDAYVARIAPDRPERLALQWHAPHDGTVEIARAIVASCAWALEGRVAERAPADLPDGGATLSRLDQLVHDARRMRRSFAVIYVDVEAPAQPSEIARDAVARRLRREVRANDHLGHLGGDAYLALLALDAGESEAYPAAQRLLRAAAAAASDASANVGVAICPLDGDEPEDLVEKAGAAAMAAASAGGTRPCWYRESAGRELAERAALRARLRDEDPGALLELRLRPVFDARTGEPWAVTAIAAWRDAGTSELAPTAYLDAEGDRPARDAVERWTIAAAAAAYRAWRAAGLSLNVHLTLHASTDPVVDAVAAGFGSDDAMRSVFAEVVPDADAGAPAVGAFVRRLRALGARVGTGAWRAAAAPFELSGGMLDFVTVDGGAGVRALAELALASVVAPIVVAGAVTDAERGRWLERHGATALAGEGLAAPMGLHQLVRWASERHGGPLS